MPLPVKRSLIFALITVVWIALTANRFYHVQQGAEQGRVLEQAGVRVSEKVLLLTRSTYVDSYRGQLEDVIQGGPNKVLDTWTDLIKQSPDDVTLRLRFAALLLAVGRSDAARPQLETAEKLAKTEVGVEALRDAYGPAKSRLDAARVERDRAALVEVLDGWTRHAALAKLYARAGDQAKAREQEEMVKAAADRTAIGFVVLGTVLTAEFGLGLLLILVWLFVGRKWNLSTEAEARFDPLAGWAMIAVWQIVAIAVSIVAVRGLGLQAKTPMEIVIVQMMVYTMLLACVGALVRGHWSEVGLHGRGLLRSMAVGMGGAFVALVLVIAAQLLVGVFVEAPGPSSNPVFEFLREAGEYQSLVALFLMVAILGPLLEEICFRGVIYGSLRRVITPGLAMIVSALVFALAHGDLNAMVPLFVLGSLLAYIFERTRSVVACWITHAIWNGQVFAIFVFMFG